MVHRCQPRTGHGAVQPRCQTPHHLVLLIGLACAVCAWQPLWALTSGAAVASSTHRSPPDARGKDQVAYRHHGGAVMEGGVRKAWRCHWRGRRWPIDHLGREAATPGVARGRTYRAILLAPPTADADPADEHRACL